MLIPTTRPPHRRACPSASSLKPRLRSGPHFHPRLLPFHPFLQPRSHPTCIFGISSSSSSSSSPLPFPQPCTCVFRSVLVFLDAASGTPRSFRSAFSVPTRQLKLRVPASLVSFIGSRLHRSYNSVEQIAAPGLASNRLHTRFHLHCVCPNPRLQARRSSQAVEAAAF